MGTETRSAFRMNKLLGVAGIGSHEASNNGVLLTVLPASAMYKYCSRTQKSLPAYYEVGMV